MLAMNVLVELRLVETRFDEWGTFLLSIGKGDGGFKSLVEMPLFNVYKLPHRGRVRPTFLNGFL